MEASRKCGFWGCWRRWGASCHEQAAGGEVFGVGEAVGCAAQDLEEVVGALDAAVGGAPGGVPGEDLGHVGDERVDDAMELGQVAGGVEVAEPVEGCECAGFVVGEVQAVQLAEGVSGGPQSGVGLEERLELGAFVVSEAIRAAQQHEPRPEHVGVERWRGAFGLAALDVAAHRGQPGGEPADDVEAVQHVAGVAHVALNGGPIRHRTVADDDLHRGAPAVSLRSKKLLNASAERCSIMSRCSPVSPLTITVT